MNPTTNNNVLAGRGFDVGTTFDLPAGASGNAADGTSVTGTLATNEAGIPDCEAYGHALVG